MKNYEQTEPRQTKKEKYQSSSVRVKKPPSLNFEFKSSLFTEKNKTLIEKLISRNVSQETSFSKEEIKEKEKLKSKTKKAFSTLKAKIPISLNTSLVENKNKANIKKNQNKLDTKTILPNILFKKIILTKLIFLIL